MFGPSASEGFCMNSEPESQQPKLNLDPTSVLKIFPQPSASFEDLRRPYKHVGCSSCEDVGSLSLFHRLTAASLARPGSVNPSGYQNPLDTTP